MSIRRLNDDLNVISALSDEPNDVEGLSAAQLKSKFDLAGNSIKTFINDSLIPDVETEIVDLVNNTAIEGGGMPAFGKAGQALVKKSDASFDWDFNYFYSIPAGGKAGYVLVKASDEDYDTHFTALPVLEWTQIAEFRSVGAFSWVAPDIYGDNKPYEIGVFIIGGGGSGAIACGNSPCFLVASGGASGYTKALRLPVTPGQSYSGAVGAGGNAVQINYTTYVNYRLGFPGGASSFAGASANGGGFGFSYSSAANDSIAVPGAQGAQGSDAATANIAPNATNAHLKFNLTAPALGSPGQPAVYASSNSFSEIICYPGGSAIPGMCRNPFTEELLLAAGGAAGAFQDGWSQSAYTFPDGSSGGAGAIAITTNAVYKNAIAGSATAVGSGGGSAVSRDNPGMLVSSGAGANGAVFIYARRAP